MTNFLHRLAARTLGLTPVVQPVIPTMFASNAPLHQNFDSMEVVEEVPFSEVKTNEIESRLTDNLLSATHDPSPTDGNLKSVERTWETLPETDLPSSHDPSGSCFAPRHENRDVSPQKGIPSSATMPGLTDLSPADSELTLPRTSRAESRIDRFEPDSDVAIHPSIPAAPRQPPAERQKLDLSSAMQSTTQMTAVFASPNDARPRAIPVVEESGVENVRPQPPVVRVTIGRIDVRAVFPSPAPAPPAPRKSPSTSLSLDDYLKQRREGKR